MTDDRLRQRRITFLAATLLFALFASYGILRPLRDNVGQYFGRELLAQVWIGTAVATVIATALVSWAAARLPRRQLAPLVFGLCAVTTLLSYLAFEAFGGATGFWLPAAFYWWVGTYLPVALALFWGLLADLRGPRAGRRTFGPIAFGGTLGQLGGAAFTEQAAEAIGLNALLAIAVALLATATALSIVLLLAAGDATGTSVGSEQRPHGVGGSWWQGFAACVRSPYLALILGYVALQTFASAVVSLEVVDAVKAHFGDNQPARTAFNASLDFKSQLVTLALQALAVGPMLSGLGAGVTLAVQPLVYTVGFLALAFTTPSALLVVVGVFEVARRSSNYGLAKPARDALFTVCTATEKYQAKSAIDAAAFRVFDSVFGQATNAWRSALAGLVGSGVAAAAVVAAPVALGWSWLALRLGRRYADKARAVEPA